MFTITEEDPIDIPDTTVLAREATVYGLDVPFPMTTSLTLVL